MYFFILISLAVLFGSVNANCKCSDMVQVECNGVVSYSELFHLHCRQYVRTVKFHKYSTVTSCAVNLKEIFPVLQQVFMPAYMCKCLSAYCQSTGAGMSTDVGLLLMTAKPAADITINSGMYKTLNSMSSMEKLPEVNEQYMVKN